jgi:hypothetical protein
VIHFGTGPDRGGLVTSLAGGTGEHMASRFVCQAIGACGVAAGTTRCHRDIGVELGR